LTRVTDANPLSDTTIVLPPPRTTARTTSASPPFLSFATAPFFLSHAASIRFGEEIHFSIDLVAHGGRRLYLGQAATGHVLLDQSR
jgi:hypothetical protein